jgi:HNH endonuclease
MVSDLPTVEMLHRLLVCDAEAGKLYWRARTADLFPVGTHGPAHNAAKWNAKFAGAKALAGTGSSHGYKAGAIFNRQYLAHRVIFAMTCGFWPVGVDHINGDRHDNRASNLRLATQAQNAMNTPGRRSRSGLIGVKPMRAGNWAAEIGHAGRVIHIGMFDTAEAAARARDAKAIELRGEFARLNFPEVAA